MNPFGGRMEYSIKAIIGNCHLIEVTLDSHFPAKSILMTQKRPWLYNSKYVFAGYHRNYFAIAWSLYTFWQREIQIMWRCFNSCPHYFMFITGTEKSFFGVYLDIVCIRMYPRSFLPLDKLDTCVQFAVFSLCLHIYLHEYRHTSIFSAGAHTWTHSYAVYLWQGECLYNIIATVGSTPRFRLVADELVFGLNVSSRETNGSLSKRIIIITNTIS